jgi:hypothetical protein
VIIESVLHIVALGIVSIVRLRRNTPGFGECGGRHGKTCGRPEVSVVFPNAGKGAAE